MSIINLNSGHGGSAESHRPEELPVFQKKHKRVPPPRQAAVMCSEISLSHPAPHFFTPPTRFSSLCSTSVSLHNSLCLQDELGVSSQCTRLSAATVCISVCRLASCELGCNGKTTEKTPKQNSYSRVCNPWEACLLESKTQASIRHCHWVDIHPAARSAFFSSSFFFQPTFSSSDLNSSVYWDFLR